MEFNQSQVLPWSIQQIDFSRLDDDCVAQEEDLIILLCAASFVESGSHIYTQNLIEFFAEDDQLRTWLVEHWEPEELQHGQALKTYVANVWPEFDWQEVYQRFLIEYSKLCSMDLLEKTPALEMVARCVVETGTATLYRAISVWAKEPILKEIVDFIRSDEVRHYKYFLQYFKEYNQRNKHSRAQIAKTLLKRLLEIKKEDSEIALRHVIMARYPNQANDMNKINARIDLIHRLIRQHLSAEMSIKMMLKPLDLSPWFQRGVEYPLTKLTQYLFFR